MAAVFFSQYFALILMNYQGKSLQVDAFGNHIKFSRFLGSKFISLCG
jgi:hypothetical protein